MSGLGDLQKRAAWYRKFAEQAGNPWIWEARLRTAEAVEAEAVALAAKFARSKENTVG
jgi:hypothetical protein